MGKRRKYEFTGETIEHDGHTLRRIRALVDINGRVTAGDKGGWIESEDNLSHKGRAWIADDARVYGDGGVLDHACAIGEATVSDSFLHDNVMVGGWARVHRSRLRDSSSVTGEARLENVTLKDQAEINGNSKIIRSAIYGRAVVYNSIIGPGVRLDMGVLRGAEIIASSQVVAFMSPVSNYTCAVYRTPGNGHRIAVGCQTFTLDDNWEHVARLGGDRTLIPFIERYRPFIEAAVKLVTS